MHFGVLDFESNAANPAMTLSRIGPACYAGGFATSLHAQAAVEYATKSASSALSHGGAGIHLGVCPVDSAVVSCVHQYYPMPFYVGIIGICLLLGLLLYPKRRS